MEKLNAQQLLFTKLDSKNIRLLAPAGSGKTLAILHRCLEQLKKEKNTEFLIFSYTRAAVAELRTRISTDKVFDSLREITDITTINAWGNKYIKNRIKQIKNPRLISSGQDRRFAVLNYLQPIWSQSIYSHFNDLLTDRKKSKNSELILELIDATKTIGVNIYDFDKKQKRYADVWQKYLKWFEHIGLNDFVHRSDYAENIHKLNLDERRGSDPQDAFAKNFLPFFTDAVNHLRSMGYYTFEDQKYFPYLDLLEKNNKGKNPAIKKKLHILVDEFQDANPLDLLLIQELVKYEDANLVIVGDDDQAIYQFRGATPKFILEPDKFFNKSFETVIFETNYRSPKNIIEHSQKLIKYNKQRVSKQIHTVKNENVKIDFINNIDFHGVLDRVLKSTAKGGNAVLISRLRGQLLPYQILLAKKGISFYVDPDLSLFESDAYKNLVDCLEIKMDNSRRWFRKIPDIVDKVLKFPLNKDRRSNLTNRITENWTTVLDEFQEENRWQNFKYQEHNYSLGEVIHFWREETEVSNTLWLMSQLFNGFKKDFELSEDDVFYTEPPFSHLIEIAEEYKDDFGQFLEDLESIRDYAKEIPREEGNLDPNTKITLATAFRTKGREFDTTIILDANSRYWPHKQAKSESEKETERRLFYVAVTRTKKELIFADANDSPTQYLNEMGLVK